MSGLLGEQAQADWLGRSPPAGSVVATRAVPNACGVLTAEGPGPMVAEEAGQLVRGVQHLRPGLSALSGMGLKMLCPGQQDTHMSEERARFLTSGLVQLVHGQRSVKGNV